MKQQLEMAVACSRLQLVWELHGSSVNPRNEIRRIVSKVAPKQRSRFEEELHEHWTRLCAQEGGD